MNKDNGILGLVHNFWQGVLAVEIPKKDSHRIMNMCHFKGITLLNLKIADNEEKRNGNHRISDRGEKRSIAHRISDKEEKGDLDRQMVEFYISLPDFYILAEFLKKADTRFHIKEKKGRPFIVNNLWRKKSSMAGFFSFFVILFLCSMFVWDIRIEGQETHTDKELMAYLGTINVKEGMKTGDVDGNEIERLMRKKFADIGWVSAQLDGSVLTIHLVEVHPETEIKKYDKPRHIIAQSDGKIVSIITRYGTPLVKKGDMVSKGAILVSGVVDIKGDDESIISRYAVMADADIMLEKTYNYKDSFPLSYEKKTTTGNKKNVYGIGLYQKYFYFTAPSLPFSKNNQEGYYSFNRENELSHTFFLPVSFIKKEYLEYEVKNAVYTENEAKNIANERLLSVLEKFKKKGVLIIENNVTINIKNGICTLRGSILVHEPVTATRNVKKKEWRMDLEDGNKADNT